MLRSFDDVSPITIRSNLKAPLHAEWSNSKKLLAIAGTRDSDNSQTSLHEYTNILKFYSVTGTLVYTAVIPYTQVCIFSKVSRGITIIYRVTRVTYRYRRVQYQRSRGVIMTDDFLSRPEHAFTQHGCQGNIIHHFFLFEHSFIDNCLPS